MSKCPSRARAAHARNGLAERMGEGDLEVPAMNKKQEKYIGASVSLCEIVRQWLTFAVDRERV
jgi:hypothetical protein